MRTLTVLFAFLALDAAGAQLFVRDTTPVPRDLALALITAQSFDGSTPTLVVGRLPDSSVAPLVPRGARVLGGLTFGQRRGPGTNHTTVLEVPETPDSIMNVLEATLERLGWRPPPIMIADEQRGGFVVGHQASYGPAGASSLMFCKDSGFLTVSATGAGHVSIVRLMVNAEMMGICDRNRNFMMRQMAMLELPTLRPPAGTTAMGGGGGGGGMGSREMSTQLRSRLTAAEMVAHFAPQLEEQGWKIASRIEQPDLSVVTAKKPAENGATLQLILVDSRFDVRSHHASVRVWNPAMRD